MESTPGTPEEIIEASFGPFQRVQIICLDSRLDTAMSSERNILLHQNPTFEHVQRELAAKEPEWTVLQPIYGPNPYWKHADQNSPIGATCRSLYAINSSVNRRYVLAVVRTSQYDRPLPIFDTPEPIIQAIIAENPDFKNKIESFTHYSSLQDAETELFDYDRLEERERRNFPTAFILTMHEPPQKFQRTASSAITPPFLQVPFVNCKSLLRSTYNLDIFPLQMIHVSSALIHAIICLAEAFKPVQTKDTSDPHSEDVREVALALADELKQFIDSLTQIVKNGEGEDFESQANTRDTINRTFIALCGDYPGAVNIRRSHKRFEELEDLDREEAELSNPTEAVRTIEEGPVLPGAEQDELVGRSGKTPVEPVRNNKERPGAILADPVPVIRDSPVETVRMVGNSVEGFDVGEEGPDSIPSGKVTDEASQNFTKSGVIESSRRFLKAQRVQKFVPVLLTATSWAAPLEEVRGGTVETVDKGLVTNPVEGASDNTSVPLIAANLSPQTIVHSNITGDIEGEISEYRTTLETTTDGDLNKPMLLNHLAVRLESRFRRSDTVDDLQEAAASLQTAVELTPDDRPAKPALLTNLGNVLQTRSVRIGDLADVDKAISSLKNAAELTPDDHPNKPSLLYSLGSMLLSRFRRIGNLEDLNQAISFQQTAVELTPDDYLDRHTLLNSVGNALQMRFERTGDLEDMERAIASLENAADLTPDGDPEKPSRLSILGTAFQSRFERLGNLADREKSISFLEKAAELTAVSTGWSIKTGDYTITNVKHGTLVFLPDPNHRTPLQGHFRRNIPGEEWRFEERVKQRYSIQNVSHKSFANSVPRAQVEDYVEGDSKEQLWRIQECSEGKFTISTTDTRVYWALPQGELETPVELSIAHADPKCWWTFTKLADEYVMIKINFTEDYGVLERLKPVDAASYREDHGCMEGTRTALLDYLVAWTLKPASQDKLLNGSNAANMYWLYGSPGLGKTSVANSLCDRLHGNRALGGSFFCRRDDPILRDSRQILPTLIAKLAGMSAPYKRLVAKALQDDPLLNPRSKRGDLLLSLLQSVKQIPPRPLVLVIDALDECGDPITRSELLTCLFETSSRVSWIKFIITSRAEHDIITFFAQNHVSSSDLAHDDQTLEDIHMFTRRRMSSIASSHYLPTDWPGNERLKQIIDRSGGLFIFVETISRYVDDPDPNPRLAEVLDGELVEANAELCKLYSIAILSRIGKRKEKFRSFTQAVVVGAMYRPLPEETLGSLVGLEPSLVRSWVDGLGSILYRDASTNGGIRVRHLSVIDFLTGPSCPEEFRVVLGQANEEMAVRCLVTMAKELKFNICELETSCTLNADIPDLDERLQEKISDALQYSSMHWANHLCADSTPASIAVSELLDAFLGGTQQLHWVEVMSLMGRVPVAIASMRLMKACFKKFEDRHQRLVEDTLRFLLAFFTPISTSTPHIYVSALPFMPRETDIWKHASISFPKMIHVYKGRAESWPAPPSIWLGHTDYVRSVAYSPDGRDIVSGSNDNTIRIWDVQTGAAMGQPLTGHSGTVRSVAYSPHGQDVVSGSDDNTIRIWDAQTGAAVGQPLTGHTNAVCSVAYSPDGRNVVSGSSDNTIRIWDAQTGAAVGQPLTGHTNAVCSVAYSPDGRNVVSGSSDNTIRIWDAQTGAAVGPPLTGHTGWVRSVAYSPDGRNVVSGSSDNTIRIWNAQTGAAVGPPLTGHTNAVCSVAYSPDGRNVVSGSSDNTIRIWNAQTGAAVGQPLTGHTNAVCSVAYSPDGRNVVSGSSDNTIRIWDAQTGAAAGQPPTGHRDYVQSDAYSPDGRNIISGSDDNTGQIWDAETGMDKDRHGVFSHSNYPYPNRQSLTTFSGRPIPITWLGPDGWVRGTEGLLFWVPEDCRYGLTSPAISTIPNMDRQRPVRIDFSRFQYGTSWINIHGGIRE